MRCYNCGSPLADDAKYCLSCGRKVGDGGQAGGSVLEGKPEHKRMEKREPKAFRLPMFYGLGLCLAIAALVAILCMQ